MKVAGSVILVTGGAGGLGEATVRHLHAGGAHVVVADLFEERAKEICADLGDRADFIVSDSLSESGASEAVEFAGSLGELRGVVATAGGGTAPSRLVGRDGTPHDLKLFTDTIALNVTTTFNTMRFAAAAMGRLAPINDDGERGAIVVTSSISATEGQIGTIAYSAAKAAIDGMVIVAARDLAASGIRVNAVAPGTMNTRVWGSVNPEVKASLMAKVPFPARFGEPAEFAALVEHLLTNGYLNAHIARLDGAIRFDPK